MPRKPPPMTDPPMDLGIAGLTLWRDTVATYELSTGELSVLRQACRCADYCESLAENIITGGLLWTDGRPNPAAVELRQQSILLARLLAALALPQEDDAQGRPGAGAPRGVYRPRPLRPVDGGA